MKNKTACSILLKFTLMVLSLVLFSVTSAQAQTATLVKEFLGMPLQGDMMEIKYTITNNDTNSFLQTVGFSDDLDATLTGMIFLGGASNNCGGTISGTSIISFSRAFMDPMSSCDFSILAKIPDSAIPGTYPSTTSMVEGNIFGGAVFSDPGASADLVVGPLLLFTKSFIDDPVNSGDPVTLEFNLTNQGALNTLTDISFTDDLDAALSGLVATGLPLSGLCGIGVVTGTSSLSFTGGRLLPLQSCSFQVSLLMPSASVPGGSYTSTTSDINWTTGMDVGSSSPASDDLRVGLPTLSKSFTDDPVFPGEEVTLEFTIANNNPTVAFTQISFTDDLDAALSGLDVQTLPDAGFCGASSTITGTTVLTITGGELAPLTSCTFIVILNVPNNAPNGNHLNTTSDLTVMSPMTTQVSDSASDELNVIGIPVLTKTFTDDPAQPGGQVTLEFSISSLNRLDDSINISFTDDLDATLSGLVATGLPLLDPCGAGSILTGTDLLTFTGGSVPPAGTCTFSVTLDIPSMAVPGIYLNTTSALISDVGGITVTGATASDFIEIEPVTLITLDWSDDPTAAGSTATMDITLTNSSSTDSASDVSFTMNFDSILPTLSSGPTSTCDGDVVFTQRIDLPPPDNTIPAHLDYGLVMPGTLAPGASCTIQVVLNVAPDASTNVYFHTSSGVTSTVNMVTYTGPPGSDDLLVVGGPTLSMVFSDNPTLPGATANLELTLTHEEIATTDATNIGFTIDLDAVDIDLAADLTHLAATGLPLNDICGMGSSISGTGLLSFSGGTLAAGASCTFNIPVFVPLDAVPNNYEVQSTAVTSTVSGIAVSGNSGSDELIIAGFIVTKEFLTNPVIPGEAVTLRYDFTNLSLTETATIITSFQDDLDDALPGLTAIGLPADNICGASSSIIGVGVGVLILNGMEIAPSTSCSLDVILQVPPSADEGIYTSTSDLQLVTLGTNFVIGAPASANLVVQNPLSLTKTFIDDVATPGDAVTLEFTIYNESTTQTITDIAFVDDLGAALTGMTFDSVILNECGGVVAGIGSNLIDVSGTSLVANMGGDASCTIQVSLTVSAMTVGGVYTNITSAITGMATGMISVTGPAATDVLSVVDLLDFSIAFDGPTTVPGNAVMTVTITNPGADIAENISFSDDLNSVIPGLIATSLPTQPCGVGSSLSGTSFLTLTGGELPPMGGMCSFDVAVIVPLTATPGTFTNTTSDLFRAGLVVADPASADLVIEPAPVFSKSFTPATIGTGLISTLTFTIDNTASALAASSLDFTDNMPSDVLIATPGNASTTCTGGTLTAANGSSVVTYNGGTVAANSSCTVSVDVTSSTIGAHVNTTGDLTSSSGNSGTAADTLTVVPAPGFTKVFAANPILLGATSTLTFTIDNTASSVAATGLSFNDMLPSDMLIATPANTTNTCIGGGMTLGQSMISITAATVAANSSCTVSIDITTNTVGSFANTSSTLASSFGVSPPATDTLVVNGAPAFSKTFGNSIISTTVGTQLEFLIDNTSSTVDAIGLDFTDMMPTEIIVGTPNNVINTCGTGTVTADPGTSTISYAGGSVSAGSSCFILVSVSSSTAGGPYVNLTGDLTSSSGNSGTATDTLNVSNLPVFSKDFMNNPTTINAVNQLTFTIDNSAGLLDILSIGFEDILPVGLEVSNPANVADNCAGSVIALPASITYSGGSVMAGGNCTISVDVVATASGSLVNATNQLQTNWGLSNSATDTLLVDAAPVVTAPEDVINMEATANLTPVMLGMAMVTDDIDMGLTASPNNFGPFAVGTHLITWTSQPDSLGSVGTDTQMVTIIDTTAPDITITDPSVIDLIIGDNYNDAGATASDLVDGDLTGDIMTTNPVDTNTLGTYLVNYSVTDSNGNNNNIDRTVNVRAIIGGTVAGLTGGETVVITDGSQQLTLSNGVYNFATQYDLTDMYLVSIDTQPGGSIMQTCMLSNQSGSITSGNINNIDINCAIDSFGINVQVTGLDPANTIELSTNGQSLPIASNGPTNFAMPVEDGQNYAVLLNAQPTQPSQECTITGGSNNDGSGLISGSDVLILVDCVTNSYLIGGMATGLETGNEITLSLNNGLNTIVINTNSAFVFSTALIDLAAYSVTVTEDTSNPSQTCQVNNGSGDLDGQDIVNVEVVCSIDQFFVGGQLTGLIDGETVTVQNNGTDNLILNSNGGFVFVTPLVDLSPYEVSVLKQTGSNGGRCTIKSNTGMIAGEDVLGVFVNCDGIDELIFKNDFESP